MPDVESSLGRAISPKVCCASLFASSTRIGTESPEVVRIHARAVSKATGET